MKKVMPAAGLLLTACQPNPDPDSRECSSAFLSYSLANIQATNSSLGGEQPNYAAVKLAEMDAIEVCGERGFLQKQANQVEQINSMNVDYLTEAADKALEVSE